MEGEEIDRSTTPRPPSTPATDPLQILINWLDTIHLPNPMHADSTTGTITNTVPYLQQCPLPILRPALTHAFTAYRTLETPFGTLVSLRERQYATQLYDHAFRFVDMLAHTRVTDMRGILADDDLCLEDLCESGSAEQILRFRADENRPEKIERTAAMFRRTIEVLLRLNWVVRERVAGLRWAIGVAQGDVDDGRMVTWWIHERP